MASPTPARAFLLEYCGDILLILSRAHGEVPQVRDAAISLALIRAYQTALGAKTQNTPAVTAAVLGTSHSINLGGRTQ